MGDDMELQYIVELMHDETEEIIKQVDCGSNLRKAQRVRDGLSINLNHSEYSVFITAKEMNPCNHTSQTN